MKNSTMRKCAISSVFVIVALVTGATIVSCSHIKRPTVPPSTSSYQIINVNVVDVKQKVIHHNATVKVTNGVINAVISNNENIQPKKLADAVNVTRELLSTTIDGTGKYLIPGLWDNHSTVLSFSPEIDFPLYIANGVTSLRSNFSCPDEKKVSIYACMKDKSAWQEAINNEQLVAPNIHGWGTFAINGKKSGHPNLPDYHGASKIEDTTKVVDHYANYPIADKPFFLKTYNWLPKQSYFELTKYALANSFEISGHLPRAVTIEEAVDAGQRSIAHARLFVYNCSNIADELRLAKGEKSKRKLPLLALYPLLMDNFDEEACIEKYKYMASNDIYLNPTLMTRRNDYYGVAGLFNEMQGLEYAHYIFFREWKEDIAKHSKNGEPFTDRDIEIFKNFYQLTAKTIADAQKHGVKLVAGSDSWSEYNVPGFSLHEELQAMSAAGIDNFSVLQAATINGAQYFRIDDKLGSIDVGKHAEMVLLNANPVTDIKNAQDIAMVFKGSKVYHAKKLNKLKAGVKEIAGSHLFTAKLVMEFLKNPTGF